MDYKEKYEQALSRARQFSEKPYLEDSAGIVEYIFPELKESELAESEDERISREIRDFICWATDRGCITKEQVEKSNSWLAWLEKQGEQKPTWSEEDEYLLDETIQHLEELIRIDKAKHCACDVQYYQRDIDWLKSLKHRMHWKPTKEQMDALWRRIAEIKISDERPSDIYTLGELHEQLENL